MSENGSMSVGYVCSSELLRQADRIPCVRRRASMVHSLIESYDLLKHMKIIPAQEASVDELRAFHSEEYVRTLQECDSEEECCAEQEDAGLGFDCPPLPQLLLLARVLAGGSLAGAEALCKDACRVAVNWCGGWHHAQRHAASGFCYVNDIVLAISRLLGRFERVLYVDLDVHHGDGVEQAFYYSPRVLTVSLHHCGPGFFPNTGAWSESGAGRGRLHALNVPLSEGASDATLYRVVQSVCSRLATAFGPQAVVVQCGADCLAGDPLGVFSVTAAGLADCVHALTRLGAPALVLGGGGYHAANTARCWARVTALLLGEALPGDVPDHRFFPEYGPSFEVDTDPGTRRDLNTEQYLQEVEERIQERAEQLLHITMDRGTR